MSSIKHRFYRQVLSIEHSQTTINGETIPVTEIVWCVREALTSRTVKTSHIGITVYVGRGPKNTGVTAYMPRKQVSINLKKPFESKFFKDLGDYSLKRSKQKAFSEAWTGYVLSRPDLSENIKGEVKWWDRTRGEGSIHIPSLDMSMWVYGCNIKGAKTGYPETACMYLERNQEVTFDLTGDCFQLFVSNVQGGHFDAEAWASLDHDRLAFKMDENGEFINGLFA